MGNTIDGVYIAADEDTNAARAAPIKLNREQKEAIKSVNVSQRMQELNFRAEDILIHIAAGNSAALGTDEEIRIFERRAAAQELLSYVAPKIKAKEVDITEEDIKPIPLYIPKRGVMSLSHKNDNSSDDN